jgi:hypothetical protein
MMVLSGDVTEDGFAHRVELAIGVEEPDDALGLLKRLNQPVEQNAIEAPVRQTNAMGVMLVEGVHGSLQVLEQPGSINP